MRTDYQDPVEIPDVPIRDRQSHAISRIRPWRTCAELRGAQLDDDGVRQLAKFKDLTVLTFFHPSQKFTGVGLADLAMLPKLENLSVGGNRVSANAGLEAVGKLSHLKSLRVYHVDIDSKGFAFLQGLKELRSLLINYNPPAIFGEDAVAILTSLHSLESITLVESRLSAASLSRLKQLPSLTRLTLDGFDISEADVEKLKADLPKAQIKWTAPTPVVLKRIQGLYEKK